tara:strand:- start:270 stop:455 length:186 start_codon:yes stop_codon:yes gene_type:complete
MFSTVMSGVLLPSSAAGRAGESSTDSAGEAQGSTCYPDSPLQNAADEGKTETAHQSTGSFG